MTFLSILTTECEQRLAEAEAKDAQVIASYESKIADLEARLKWQEERYAKSAAALQVGSCPMLSPLFFLCPHVPWLTR